MPMELQALFDALSPAVGICPFARVENALLPCAASARLPRHTQSLIVALFPYYLGEEAYRGANISRYACVPDYHAVVLHRLERLCVSLREKYPQEEFVPFCDNSPIPEVRAAQYAGLGSVGKNGLLLHPVFGSYVFIGAIACTLALPAAETQRADGCTGCLRCKAACPNGALGETAFFRVRCLSHITQKKGALTEEEQALLRASGCAWGCDICQTVCPQNRVLPLTPIPEFRTRLRCRITTGEPLEGRAYAWRGRDGIGRNLRYIKGETP